MQTHFAHAHTHQHAGHHPNAHSIAAVVSGLSGIRRATGSGSGAEKSLERSSLNHSRHGRSESCASLLLFELEMEEQAERHIDKNVKLPTELQSGWGTSPSCAALWVACLNAKDQLLADLGEADEDAHVDVAQFAQQLADAGFNAWLRRGTCTAPPDSGLGAITHTFVVVALPGPPPTGQVTYMVVDPNYKAPFQLAGAHTSQYRALMGLLPPVLVGSAEQIILLVNFLCKEMEKVFTARGVSLPPWRAPQLMNRWLVTQVHDTPVHPSSDQVPSTRPGEPAMTAAVETAGTPRQLVFA